MNLEERKVIEWYYNRRRDIRDGSFKIPDEFAREIGYDVVDQAISQILNK